MVAPKEPVRSDIAPKKISHIEFGLLSSQEMERVSEFQVSSTKDLMWVIHVIASIILTPFLHTCVLSLKVYRSDLFTMPQVCKDIDRRLRVSYLTFPSTCSF